MCGPLLEITRSPLLLAFPNFSFPLEVMTFPVSSSAGARWGVWRRREGKHVCVPLYVHRCMHGMEEGGGRGVSGLFCILVPTHGTPRASCRTGLSL